MTNRYRRTKMNITRRNFVKATAATAASASLIGLQKALGASSIQDTPIPKAKRHYINLCRPKSPNYKMPSETGLKIKSIETFTDGYTSIVRIRTDDGAEGYGQISTYDADISAMVLHRKIAQLALGADPGKIDDLVDRCIEENYKYPWSYICRALAGLDTAVWDLLAKRERKSVCELLGAKPRAIPAYGSSMRRDITPKDEANRLVRLRDSNGYRAFKIRIGKVCGHDQDQWPGRTEALVPTVRKALGDNINIQVGRMLEDNNVGHLEEPCPYWELEWTAEVAAALKVPVAGGEQDNDLAQWRRMIEINAVDIVQPDILYVGGLTRALRVAQMANDAGKLCVPHSANLAMVTIFTLHMLSVIPNAGPHIEFAIEPWDWFDGIYYPELKVKDGLVAIPEGSGWGVTINPKWLEKAKHQITKAE